ncbi:MAG: hypothetical protein ACE5JL_06470 [Dehalococcoidia bacterium]
MESYDLGHGHEDVEVELYECPSCGTENEMFSNENKVKCYQCGGMIRRQGGDKDGV